MKKRILLSVILTAFMAISAYAGVDVRIGIPIPLPPSVVIQTAPEFIYSPSLGFYVSVGAPNDIVFIGNEYYLYNDGYYYRSHSYNGPWEGVDARRLPPGLRKHKYQDIRRFRDKEYRTYDRDRERYRGRWHRPEEVPRSGGHGVEVPGGGRHVDVPGGGRHGVEVPGGGHIDVPGGGRRGVEVPGGGHVDVPGGGRHGVEVPGGGHVDVPGGGRHGDERRGGEGRP